jgi:hypothetical protein
MAIRDDTDLPGLVPFDDRLPSRAGLFRKAEDMPDDQFALLAAEWAEGDAGADCLSEIEAIFAASQERKALAEDFKRIRLIPGNEKWTGKEAMIKTLPSAFYFNRIMYATLAAAAVFLAFLALSPLLRNSVSQSSPAMLPETRISAAATGPVRDPGGAAAKNPVRDPGRAASISPALDPERVTAGKTVNVIQTTVNPVPASEMLKTGAGQNPRTEPFGFRNNPETVRLIAGVSSAELTAVERIPVQTDIRPQYGEANWIIRGISALSGIVTGKDKPVDGYMIAGACVKGINSVLGWDMDLERVTSDDGNPLAVNFSSSLLSFSTPAKKSSDEP